MLKSFLKVYEMEGNPDIVYPICFVGRSGLTLSDAQLSQISVVFPKMVNQAANDWNVAVRRALENIGESWPIDSVTFMPSCDSIHGLRPLTINIRLPSVGFGLSAGNHELNWPLPGALAPKGGHGIYHEYGHVLGLADDYRGAAEQGNRPKAIMKFGSEDGKIQPEDIVALSNLWKYRNNPDEAKCPSGYFTIDEYERTAAVENNLFTCIPYVRHEITNAIGDNCIAFFDDDERRGHIRAANPQNYFRKMIGEPICIDDNATSLILPFPNDRELPDSLWVGKNVHAQTRGLSLLRNSERYLTINERYIPYPWAWFHLPLEDKEPPYQFEEVTAVAISIFPRTTKIVSENIPEVDLQRSKSWSGSNWNNQIDDMVTNRPGKSCSHLLAEDPGLKNKDGIYRIRRDNYSDQQVFCDMTTDGGGWTYTAYYSGEGRVGPIFYRNVGEFQLDPTHPKNSSGKNWEDDERRRSEVLDRRGNNSYNTVTYSNGLPSKLSDNEMMIKVHNYESGPQYFLKYDRNFPLFNEKYSPCEKDSRDALEIKTDSDTKYKPGNVHCQDRSERHRQLRFNQQNKNVFDIKQNWAFGIQVSDNNFRAKNPTRTQPKERGYQGWIFVRDSQASAEPTPTPMVPTPLPTAEPTMVPTSIPTLAPTLAPTARPTPITPPIPNATPRATSTPVATEPPRISNRYQLAWSQGGCEQHFEQRKMQTVKSCAQACADSTECETFAIGRQDDHSGRSGWCNLYKNQCKNNADKTWDTYNMIQSAPVPKPTPETKYTLSWEQGGCNEHFENILEQSKGQTLDSCAEACGENNQCSSFSIGREDDKSGRNGWCNLYKNQCTQNTDQSWNTYRLIQNPVTEDTIITINPNEEGFFIIHKATGAKLHSCGETEGETISAVSEDETNDCAKWIKNFEGNAMYIKNVETGMLLGINTASVNTPITLMDKKRRTSQWYFTQTSDGYGYLRNRFSKKHIYLSAEGEDGEVLQQPSSWRNDFTLWRFE